MTQKILEEGALRCFFYFHRDLLNSSLKTQGKVNPLKSME